jgi:2-hydroxychromene-2-carboxylate isomerase
LLLIPSLHLCHHNQQNKDDDECAAKVANHAGLDKQSAISEARVRPAPN